MAGANDPSIVGKISFDRNDQKRIVIDAKPFVMQRIRPLFKGITPIDGGEHTHKPISIPLTMDHAKDMEMLLFRYRFSIDHELGERIHERSREYDEIFNRIAAIEEHRIYQPTELALKFQIALREHQISFNNFLKIHKKILLADPIGQGKTFSAISILSEPFARPAIVVTPTTLCHQWKAQIARILPELKVHIIEGFKTYPLPNADVVITSYNRLRPWQDIIFATPGYFKTAIFEEAHELRKTDTEKREHSRRLSEQAVFSIGLSATPIMNYGVEVWSVLDAIHPDCLGPEYDFKAEWCQDQRVRDTHALHGYLVSRGLMVRRPKAKETTPTKEVIAINADLKTLKETNDVAKMLALSVLSNKVGETDDAIRDFDWQLRQMTGVAKARPVAEFVRSLVQQGEKVLLAGWHRQVYDIWEDELADCNPVWFTGSETPNEKQESIKRFVDGDSMVMVMSLRSGAGIDGLQHVASTVVFGELDWSPQIMDQLIGRLDREGQQKQVMVYYLLVEDGSDPFISDILNLKRSQAAGVVEGVIAEGKVLETNGDKSERIRAMARAYLESIGEEIAEPVEETGLFGRVIELLRRTAVPTNNEDEMQVATHIILETLQTREPSEDESTPGFTPYKPDDVIVHREYKATPRSRIDFLVQTGDGSERVAVELKIHSTQRAEVYRQVRKYAKEANITSLVLFAPWSGVESFVVDEIKVVVVNFSKRSL